MGGAPPVGRNVTCSFTAREGNKHVHRGATAPPFLLSTWNRTASDSYRPRLTVGVHIHITQEKKEAEMKALLEQSLPMFARVRTWWRLLLVTLQEKHEW